MINVESVETNCKINEYFTGCWSSRKVNAIVTKVYSVNYSFIPVNAAKQINRKKIVY